MGVTHDSRRPSKPLWVCPACERTFANANQSHACARHTLDEHLTGKTPEVLAIYRRLEAVAQRLGPALVLPEATRIAFHVRMSFAAVSLHRRWVDGHVVLARRLEAPRFRRIDTISPRNHVHVVRIAAVDEVDAEVEAWFAEAYLVGEQRHLLR